MIKTIIVGTLLYGIFCSLVYFEPLSPQLGTIQLLRQNNQYFYKGTILYPKGRFFWFNKSIVYGKASFDIPANETITAEQISKQDITEIKWFVNWGTLIAGYFVALCVCIAMHRLICFWRKPIVPDILSGKQKD